MNFFNIILFSIAWGAGPERLSSIHKDLSQADRILIAPGLVSVLEFPNAVSEVRVGHPGVLKVQISTVSPKELTLFLSGASMTATNLIVRAEKRLFVFDVVPSKTSHQDYLKIRSGFGGPRIHSSAGRVLEAQTISAKSRLRLNAEGLVVHSKKLGAGQ